MTETIARVQDALHDRYGVQRELGQGGIGNRLLGCVGVSLLLAVAGSVPARAQCPDGTAPPCRVAAPPGSAPNSIAVISFGVEDSTDRILAREFSERVATALAGTPSVLVKPWSLTGRMQSASRDDIGRIAETLGVRYVVDGVLRRDRTGVAVVVEVFDAPARGTLFATSYRYEPDSLAALASRVARDVARETVPPARTPRPILQKVLFVVSGLLPAVAQVAGAMIFIWGVVVVAVGRFTAGRARLRGRTARIAGLYLVSQLPLALAVAYAVHRAQFHGDEVARGTSRGFAAAAVWAFFAIAGVLGARMYAQGKRPAGDAASPRRESS